MARSRPYWLLLVWAVALVSAPTSAYGKSSSQEVVVERGTLKQVHLLTGTLAALDSEDYSVPPSDQWRMQVKWIVEEGSAVNAGDPIVRLDTANLLSDIVQQEASLIEKQEQIAIRRSAGKAKRLDLEIEYKKAEIEKKKAALDASIPKSLQSEKQHRENRLALAKAKIAYDDARLALDAHDTVVASEIKELEIEAAGIRRRLERKKAYLEAMTIRARRSGIVLYKIHWNVGRKVQVGDTVYQYQGLVEIPQVESMAVRAWVNEVDRDRLAVGAKVNVRLDAYLKDEYPGTIESVSAVSQSLGNRSKSPYYEVIISLERLDLEKMRPGMSVVAEVVIQEEPDALLVPLDYISEKNGESFVRPKGKSPVKVSIVGRDDFRAALGDEAGIREGVVLEFPSK